MAHKYFPVVLECQSNIEGCILFKLLNFLVYKKKKEKVFNSNTCQLCLKIKRTKFFSLMNHTCITNTRNLIYGDSLEVISICFYQSLKIGHVVLSMLFARPLFGKNGNIRRINFKFHQF